MDDAVLALGQWTLSLIRKAGDASPQSSPVETKGVANVGEDTLINGWRYTDESSVGKQRPIGVQNVARI